MLENFKEVLRKNLLVYSILVFLINLPKNIRLKLQISWLCRVDCIGDYEKFCDYVRPLLKKNTMQIVSQYGDESYLYGHYKELLKYAGIRDTIIPAISGLEHGVNFTGEKVFKPNIFCYGVQSEERKKYITRYEHNKPVITLGPYIHYATPYYSPKQVRSFKLKYGKVLLVMQSHTCEEIKDPTEYRKDISLIDVIYKKYKHYYDTIVVCVYWNDIDNPIYDRYKKNGAILVSAGFRGDNNFIKRLKSIIYMSDALVVDDLGTNIGYALYMNKTVYFEPNQYVFTNGNTTYLNNVKRYISAFYTENLAFTPDQIRMQNLLYKEFWGGDSQIKSPEEIRNVIMVIKKILKYSNYNYNKAIKNLNSFDSIECSKLNECGKKAVVKMLY